MKQEMHYWAQE